MSKMRIPEHIINDYDKLMSFILSYHASKIICLFEDWRRDTICLEITEKQVKIEQILKELHQLRNNNAFYFRGDFKSIYIDAVKSKITNVIEEYFSISQLPFEIQSSLNFDKGTLNDYL